MRNWVNEWVQEGAIYIWRYPKTNRARKGWHFTGNPAGCRSIRNLLDRMRGGEDCYRTLKLGRITEDVWRVPNFGLPKKDCFSSLRLEFRPDFEDLEIDVVEERLVLTVGNNRIKSLGAAFAQVEIGNGDFGIATSDNRRAESWMFWWM